MVFFRWDVEPDLPMQQILTFEDTSTRLVLPSVHPKSLNTSKISLLVVMGYRTKRHSVFKYDKIESMWGSSKASIGTYEFALKDNTKSVKESQANDILFLYGILLCVFGSITLASFAYLIIWDIWQSF